MAFSSRSGGAKSIFSSLLVLLLVAIFAITARSISKSPTELLSPSFEVVSHGGDDVKHVPNAALEAQAAVEKRAAIEKRTVYQDKIEKGRYLSCLMKATAAEAATMNGGTSWEAEVQNPQYFGVEGWEDPTNELTQPFFKNALDNAFTLLGIDKASNVMKDYENTSDGFILYGPIDDPTDLLEIEPTGGRFENVFNAEGGAIIADFNQSPQNMLLTGQVGSTDITRIRQWSDAAFLQWVQVCDEASTDVSNLKYIFRATITNVETQSIVLATLSSQSVSDVPKWAGRITYTEAENPDQFYAILGSKNGAGCAYLLIQHKEKLGVKRITSVTLWTSGVAFPIGMDTDYLKLQIYFTVEDVENPVSSRDILST